MKTKLEAGAARAPSLAAALLFALASAVSSWPSIAQTQHWVATWGASPDSTGQAFGGQTLRSPAGNFTNAATLPVASTSSSRFFLSAVYVLAAQQSVAIIAFGDSITDGVNSSFNANHRWPDDLAGRLAAARLPPPIVVVNEGIGGNRVLANGLGPDGKRHQPGAVLISV